MRGVPGLGSSRGGSGRAPLAAEGRGFRVQEWRWLRGRFPTKGTFLELRDPLTRSRRGARSAEPLGARREPQSLCTTRTVIAKVAGNPFSRARDNEQERKGIQVEKSVNTRTTHSWSCEVSIKLCVLLSLSGKKALLLFFSNKCLEKLSL